MTLFSRSNLKKKKTITTCILKKFKASRFKINKRADGDIWVILKTKILQIKLLIRRLGRIVGANTILGDPTSSSLLRKDTALTGHAQFPAVKAS